MGQPDRQGNDTPMDVTFAGARADADYGPGAEFNNANKRNLTREECEQAFSSLWDQAQRYRFPLETEWMTEYQQYHGHVDDPARSPWQSQAHVPKAAEAVDVAASRISQVMFSSEGWFGVVSDAKVQDRRVERARKLIDRRLKMNDGAAIDGLNQAVKNALICGNGPVKVHFAQQIKRRFRSKWVEREPIEFLGVKMGGGGDFKAGYVDRAERVLRVEPIIPTDAWLDSTGLNRFMIVKHRRSLSDLWALARDQKGEDGKTVIRKAVYDPEVVKLIRPGARDARLDQLSGVIRREFPVSQGEQMIDVYELWGDLPDPRSGVTLYRNILMTIVDRKWCVRMPEVNPFYHGESALLWIRARLQPNQIYGRGLIAHGIRLQTELDRMLRAFQDKTHLSISVMEVDTSAAKHADQFKGGHIEWYPGKLFQRKSGPDRKIFNRVEGPDPVNQYEVELFGVVRQLLNETYGVSEWSTGVEDSMDRRRRTKSEVQTRSSLAQQPFNEVAQYVERTGLTPFINRVYSLIAQFEDEWAAPDMLELFSNSPEDLQEIQLLGSLSPEERWERMQLKTQLRVSGVTLEVTRNQLLGRLNQFMAMMAADPLYQPLINREFIIRTYRLLSDLPPDVLVQGWDRIAQAMQAGMLMQLQGGPAAGGGPMATPGGPAKQIRGENQNNTAVAMGARGREAAG